MRLVLDLPGAEIEIVERNTEGAYPWLIKVGNLFLSARAGHLEGLGVGESASMTVELDNEGKQASALLGYCLRVSASLYDGADLVFVGLVQRIQIGPTLALTIEA